MDADSDWEKPHNNRVRGWKDKIRKPRSAKDWAAFTRSWEEARKDLLSILEGRNPY